LPWWPFEGAVDETPVRDSRLAGADEFLAGSAECASWTQLGGHLTPGITDSGERNKTSAGDEHGCDRVRDTEGMHGGVLERCSQENPLAGGQSNQTG
jgi:hypothetical protein